MDDVLLAVLRAEPQVEQLPPVDSLRAFCVATLTRTALATAEPGLRRSAAELIAATAGDERLAEAFQDSLADVRAEGHRWIAAARAEGVVRYDVDADVLLDLLAAAAYYPLLWRGEALAVNRVTAVVDLLLDGAAPRGDAGQTS